ncbi:GNAT family N-acetyltransferase [Chitinophaga sp. RCC_12]|uniref:GNAT family N-acetyltransferase n=1 Tax=Chitinophaga sp. RCC_12 TaxID=3239226 RepID=UPI003524EFC0
MEIFASTPRLILRELIPADAAGMFELDSDEAVHLYLGNKPVSTIEESREAIQLIRQQYRENGIGRWAVIEKDTNQFVGWAGLKLIKEPTNGHVNYYDLGYRFIKKYWGKGYATECARASLEYGFNRLGLENIYAIADVNNDASKRVLEKVGLSLDGTFHDGETMHNWFTISREAWNRSRN